MDPDPRAGYNACVTDAGVLMRERDEPDGVYLVRAGRLRARVGSGEELVVLGSASVHEDGGDVLIRPDVERFPMRDCSRFDALVEVGHAEALALLGPWWQEQRRVA